MLSKRINGHQSTYTVVNLWPTSTHPHPIQSAPSPGMLVGPCHSQTPWCNPNHVCRQFEMAYQLLLQSWQSPGINIWNPHSASPIPTSLLPPSGTCKRYGQSISTADESHSIGWMLPVFMSSPWSFDTKQIVSHSSHHFNLFWIILNNY